MQQGVLTSTQTLLVTRGRALLYRRLETLQSTRTVATDDTSTTLLSLLLPSGFLDLSRSRSALVATGTASLRLPEQLPHLEKISLDSGDETLRLSVLGRGADTDAAVFDDITDTETIAAGRAETEVAERRVAAVRG